MKGKISLCMIVGNVEEYIQRCLTSFLPHVDELVLVRAIGNQTPDRTEHMARELCELHRIPIRFAEYLNRKNESPSSILPPPSSPIVEDDPTTWPHLDNFAAARQMSFDLASHDWCLWADSDDVLHEGGPLLLEHAASDEFAAYLLPYRIHGRGVELNRERLINRKLGRWRYAVHECIEFNTEKKAAIDDRIVVLHLPKMEKTGSHTRNLRILGSIPEAEMNTGLLFHLVEELLIDRNIDGAAAVAQKLLARPDLARPEKMDLFLNLAAASKDPNQKQAFFIQAYAADPRRREPLLQLCNHAVNYGHYEDALAFGRAMISLPPLKDVPWNNRESAYGWNGDDVFQQALRVNGFSAAAEAVRQERFKQHGGPRIALIHATRGRPEKAALARKFWLEAAAHPETVEHVFVFDSDDKESLCLARFHHHQIPPGGGCVRAWNSGALLSQAPILIQMSDDWLPPAHWDDLIVERLGDLSEAKVLAISDGTRRDDLLCMAICTRTYLEQDYFLFHPWFTGVYSDNWFTEEAYRRGAVIEARDLVFQHHHPIFGKAEMDETYRRQNATERYAEGRAIYERLSERNDWSSIPGWFNYWPLYQTIAQIVKDGDHLCEIGVWLGRSIIYLAQELQRLGKTKCKLYVVDTFKGEANEPEHAPVVARFGGSLRAEFERNLKRCGVADMVTVLEGDSAAMAAQVAEGSLAFCFVDAAHDYASVKGDVMAWNRKVKPGGIIAGHDAQWHEVTKAATDVLGEIQVLGGIWMKEVK